MVSLTDCPTYNVISLFNWTCQRKGPKINKRVLVGNKSFAGRPFGRTVHMYMSHTAKNANLRTFDIISMTKGPLERFPPVKTAIHRGEKWLAYPPPSPHNPGLTPVTEKICVFLCVYITRLSPLVYRFWSYIFDGVIFTSIAPPTGSAQVFCG